jgi:hypothetical protein
VAHVGLNRPRPSFVFKTSSNESIDGFWKEGTE